MSRQPLTIKLESYRQKITISVVKLKKEMMKF
jgi:hypothetical protein